jgi:3'(2'), 5'-bisphosphate nucleotidase
MPLHQALAIAIEAVQKSSEVCRWLRAHPICEQAIAKQDRSPVTIADFASQAVIIHTLHQKLGKCPVVAEEEAGQMQHLKGTALGSTMLEAMGQVIPDLDWDRVIDLIGRGSHCGGSDHAFWALDPIDGTKGFLRNEQYAVALALIVNGKPVMGVLGCPNYPIPGFSGQTSSRGRLFYAMKQSGAWSVPLDDPSAKPEKVEVAPTLNLQEIRIAESFESGHSAHGKSADIAATLGIQTPPLRIDSQCKYAAVACGDASLYLRLPVGEHYEEKIWDHAAGYVLLNEAGGITCDTLGKELDFSRGRTLSANKGVVAAPAKLMNAILTKGLGLTSSLS